MSLHIHAKVGIILCWAFLSSRAFAAPTDLVCPNGFFVVSANANGGKICASSLEGVGPFTPSMEEYCRVVVGGGAACGNDKWALSVVKQAYGSGTCPNGSLTLGEYCADSQYAYGPFTLHHHNTCAQLNLAECNKNRWPLNTLFQVQNAAVPSIIITRNQALAIFYPLEFYHIPFLAQDTDGDGIYGVHTLSAANTDLRSEKIYPPFILSPRRQTDSMVRQLYTLLPKSITDTTAFVVGDRFAQNPEAYSPYIMSRQKIVIAGSFMGLGAIADRSSYDASWAKGQHARELSQLEGILALARANGQTVVNVTYAMGDSSGAFGLSIRREMESKMNTLLVKYGFAQLQTKLSWGADETIAMAMAKLLPDMRLKVSYENPAAQQWYDAKNTAQTITEEKLFSLGLSLSNISTFDMELAVFSRRAGGSINDYQANDNLQASLDNAFANKFKNYTAAQRAKLVIVDGRLFNGAWNTKSLITNNPDYLSYGAWGTFGNKIGLTLAVAKIVYNNPIARQQLFLESVAHDQFMGGYAEAQRGQLYLNINYALGNAKWNNYNGWKTENETSAAFWEINQFVNARMKAFYGAKLGTKSFRLSPQFWRSFEADVRMLPADIAMPVGVYRTSPSFMDPTDGIFPSLKLEQIFH